MISYVKGKIRCRIQNALTVDVNGIGYEVHVPTYVVLNHRNIGDEVELWIYTKVREDAIQLYGFRTLSERQIFKLLIGINKVGPKIALAALSTINPRLMRYAVEHGKHEVFASVGGIGPTLAQKIIVDLKNKLGKWPATDENQEDYPQLMKNIQLDFEHFGLEDGSSDSENHNTIRDDIISALENLGYRSKDISKAVSKLEIHENADDSDFSNLLKDALSSFQKSTPQKSTDPREVF